MIRQPVVAGTFYPASKMDLQETLRTLLMPVCEKHEAVLGVLSPHAGYLYSGAVAGALFARIHIPDDVIILCPNHTGLGPRYSLWPGGEWRTPLGTASISEELNAILCKAHPAIEEDTKAHVREHAAEVQVPFLQYCNPNVRLSVVVIASYGHTSAESELDALTAFGKGLGEQIQLSGKDILIVASSDMNHFANNEETKVLDRMAITQLESLNAHGLYDTIKKHGISMCGYAPAIVMMTACTYLGAKKAELVHYDTSASCSGDDDRVVGYAGMKLS